MCKSQNGISLYGCHSGNWFELFEDSKVVAQMCFSGFLFVSLAMAYFLADESLMLSEVNINGTCTSPNMHQRIAHLGDDSFRHHVDQNKQRILQARRALRHSGTRPNTLTLNPTHKLKPVAKLQA